METQFTPTPWNNMLAQFGLADPDLPKNAPVSAKHENPIKSNAPGLDDLFISVFESNDE